jgi:hypothetical protein
MTQTKPEEKETPQPNVEEFKERPQAFHFAADNPDLKVKYDVGEIEEFMDMVFAAADPDDPNERTLCWATPKTSPGFPASEEVTLQRLKRATIPMALYFGTSTCRPDDTGALRNRKALFTRLHVVVLDDIGTKVPVEKIPKSLKPTYIIESSEGNFQYGYVLKVPIDDVQHAQALIQLVYGSGFSDAGGMMPTKLVRLPGGVNGKTGPKKYFKVKLIKKDGPRWTPEKLLEEMQVDVRWQDVLDDPDAFVKKHASRSVGTSPWSPVMAEAPAMGGIVDPLLEYLYDKKQVFSESDPWAEVLCPWAINHTNNNPLSGYKPLGRGSGSEEFRAFKCFHDSCKDKHTSDFLNHHATTGGPEVGVFDPAAKLVAGWAYDSSGDVVWQIQGVTQPRSISMNAFKNTFPRKVRVYTRDGKAKLVAETQLWLTSPGRVVVQGQTFNPHNTAKIVEDGDDLLINMFHQPEWGDGLYDQEDVDMFMGFMEYLIPIDREREYFLDWLAAKMQNLAFRGAAILMIAKQQGTGRTTLADMLETIIGVENVENVPFSRLTGDGVFNDWMEKPLVVTNETKDTAENKSYYKVYESLKDYVDPRPKRERINPKYGQHRFSMVYSSYLMFSNHDNALAVAGNDRRFYVMRNAIVPAEPAYFTALNKWLEIKDPLGKPKWAKSIWRWLRKREVDIEALLAPAPSTEAKKAMIEASKNPLSVAVEAAVDAFPGDFVILSDIKNAISQFAVRLNLHNVNNLDAQIKAVMRYKTEGVNCGTIKIAGRSMRPKIKMISLAKAGYVKRFLATEVSKPDRAFIREQVLLADPEILKEKVSEALDLVDV